MRTPMEDMMKEFAEFMKGKEAPRDEAERSALLQEFMQGYNQSLSARVPVTEKTAQTSEDFLELAENARSRKKRHAYLQKALELDAGNFDAVIGLAVEMADKPLEMIACLRSVVEKAQKLMEAKGYYDKECIGNFWLIHETRPYMRLLRFHMEVLASQCRYRCAIEAGKEMLRLCEGDNLGVRYHLVALYALLQEKEAAEALSKEYEEEGTMFLFPMAYMYYLLEEEEKAEEALQGLLECNKDTKKFFSAMGKLPSSYRPSPYGVTMGSMDEYAECMKYAPGDLYESRAFWEWAKETVKKKKKTGA